MTCPKYKVTAELTPFFDRWGSEHYRTIYLGRWLFTALYRAWLHEAAHPPYGRAWVERLNKAP